MNNQPNTPPNLCETKILISPSIVLHTQAYLGKSRLQASMTKNVQKESIDDEKQGMVQVRTGLI